MEKKCGADSPGCSLQTIRVWIYYKAFFSLAAVLFHTHSLREQPKFEIESGFTSVFNGIRENVQINHLEKTKGQYEHHSVTNCVGKEEEKNILTFDRRLYSNKGQVSYGKYSCVKTS